MMREREYKRARRQISEGIQGAAIGAALVVGAGVAYFLLPKGNVYYAVSLVLALGGLIKLFRSVAHVVDAKVGSKLMGASQTYSRGSGGLTASTPLQPAPVTTRVAQQQPPRSTPLGPAPPPAKQPDPQPATPVLPVPGTTRVGTSRVGREGLGQMGKPEKEDDLLSRLRN
jgi:hypothetical protein